MPWECLIPRKQREFSKSLYSKPNDVEVYGFRPMIHPWKLLSPFDFAMKWRAEPVLPPHAYSRSGLEQRSEWAKNVEAAVRSQEKLAIPGVAPRRRGVANVFHVSFGTNGYICILPACMGVGPQATP